ncbi:lyase family protein [Patescibacteria group bacterium]|nr:lyase family protein [Patescibacteria group bacterium]
MQNRILYGPQTKAAIENFPFDYPLAHLEFYQAVVLIKKAAAVANFKAGKISPEQSRKIIKACDDILSGKYNGQFVVKGLHGGAGTSVNMNVNEVVANLAGVHPNDQVNASQSTNDVNPSALKIAGIKLTKRLLQNLLYLIKVIEARAKECKSVKKLGRTHMQDAVPTTLGAEFQSYADILKRDKKRIEDSLKYFYELNLGGTAVGNSINAPKVYLETVYAELKKIAGIKELKPLKNLMSGTSSDTDFCQLSSSVNLLCLDISKMAADLRFMSSGPKGGIGEISFQEMQQGSSIMPGKVNPVICETMNQIYFQVDGRNTTIHHAAENSHLELGVMLPAIADSLITMLKIVDSGLRLFADRGIKKIVVNEKRCLELLEKSTAYATLLSPKLGYDTVSKIVKEAVATGKTLRQVVLEKKLLTEKEFNKLLI